MEVSISGSLMKSTNHHFLTTLLLSKSHPLNLSSNPPPLRSYHHTLSFSNPNSHLRPHFPNSKTSLFTKPSSQPIINTPISINRFARILSGHEDRSFEWKFSLDGVNNGELGFIPNDNRPVVTVVVLGWLGSKQKHLRRYAEMYNMLGMDAVTFAASVNDVLGFDLGKKFETRIASLTHALVSWLEENANNGK